MSSPSASRRKFGHVFRCSDRAVRARMHAGRSRFRRPGCSALSVRWYNKLYRHVQADYAGAGPLAAENSSQVLGVLLVQTIAIQQAKVKLSEIIDNLSPGEEAILTRDNKPVATIRATPNSPEPPRFGTLRASILHSAPDFDAISEGFEDDLP